MDRLEDANYLVPGVVTVRKRNRPALVVRLQVYV